MDFLQGAQSKCECALLLYLHYYTANSWRSSVQMAHLPGQNLHCSDVQRREGETVAGRRIAAASTDAASPGVWGSSDGANLSHKATVLHSCCVKCHKRFRDVAGLKPLLAQIYKYPNLVCVQRLYSYMPFLTTSLTTGLTGAGLVLPNLR